MAWTSVLGEIRKLADIIEVEVGYFKDGVHIVNKTYRTAGAPPTEWLEKQAERTVEKLIEVDGVQLDLGPIGNPTPPIPEDPGLIAFRQDVRRLDLILKLVQLGVLPVDHVKVVEFVNRFRGELITYWSEV